MPRVGCTFILVIAIKLVVHVLVVQSEAGVVCRKYVDLTQLIHEYMQRGSKNGMAGPLLYPIASDSVSDDEDSAGLLFQKITTGNLSVNIAFCVCPSC